MVLYKHIQELNFHFRLNRFLQKKKELCNDVSIERIKNNAQKSNAFSRNHNVPIDLTDLCHPKVILPFTISSKIETTFFYFRLGIMHFSNYISGDALIVYDLVKF